ncbi:MGMT family protein [Patescibacteria group bacterium]
MNFYQAVYQVVSKIPKGKVATYGQVATILSSARSAQVVGWALRALPEDSNIPWQRVVGRQGRITIIHPRAPKELQAKLLTREGIKVEKKENNFFIDLNIYLWRIK